MSILHTVNKSPLTNHSLAECLKYAQKNSAILLMEDGVYGALTQTKASEFISQALKHHKIYALKADTEARGLTSFIVGITLIDYAQFVELTTQYDSVQSWF